MKNGSFLLAVMIVALLSLFVVGGIQAGTKAQEVIKFENSKGLVELSHEKHVKEYNIACGECHHDADGKPLADLKSGDEVQGCKECHKIPGEVPKDVKKEWKAKKLKKAEKQKLELEYAAEAYHANCIDCHKAFNKKNKTKAAPATCKKCHAKND